MYPEVQEYLKAIERVLTNDLELFEYNAVEQILKECYDRGDDSIRRYYESINADLESENKSLRRKLQEIEDEELGYT